MKDRLARGGNDAVGADIAVMPLPAFVVAYDSLRILDPRAFAVVGFSRGREEMHTAPNALLKAPPAGDEVKLVALGPATASDASAKAAGSESATLLGLFGLDLLGVPSARVRMIAPGAADAKAAPFAAIVRGAADDRKLAFSTSDASRLVPIVAIAPKKQLDESEPKMRAFALAWLDGLARAGKDASNVARRLANKEALPLGAGVGGAPEAIALLDRLGQIEPATLAQQSTLIGPGAKGAVTLETLTQRTWSLARAGGLTTSAAPDPLPIDARVVTAIAPPPPAPAPAATDGGAADAGALAPLPSGSTPLVVYRASGADVDAASVAARNRLLGGRLRARRLPSEREGRRQGRARHRSASARPLHASGVAPRDRGRRTRRRRVRDRRGRHASLAIRAERRGAAEAQSQRGDFLDRTCAGDDASQVTRVSTKKTLRCPASPRLRVLFSRQRNVSMNAHVALPAWGHRPWPRPGIWHTPTGWKQPWRDTHGGSHALDVPVPQRFAYDQ